MRAREKEPVPFKDKTRQKEYDRQRQLTNPRDARRTLEDNRRRPPTTELKSALEREADRILLASVESEDGLRAYGVFIRLPSEITYSQIEDFVGGEDKDLTQEDFIEMMQPEHPITGRHTKGRYTKVGHSAIEEWTGKPRFSGDGTGE